MKRFLFRAGRILGLTLILTCSPLLQARSLFIEDLTWEEVAVEIANGKTTAIIFAGSTEQNGPHMVLGKHTFVARYLAERIASELGDALVYPIFPFAPTGDAITRTGHMRFPGSVNVSESQFVAVMHDVALSAATAGFKNILLMGDHGGGQAALAVLAQTLDAQMSSRGIRVFHIAAVYEPPEATLAIKQRGTLLNPNAHAGTIDTSTLMAIDPGEHWVRHDLLTKANTTNGAEEDPRDATVDLGRQILSLRVSAALVQIRALMLSRR
ncbi:MAG: creatininase family protein [Rhodocyclaceae bacterium]|nr:creatininase family protein [Rhodocyclaceae bacterium]MBK9623599.1 creatininase family protein [Rhodocyclaceae bacterium]MBL0075225.1 creatininase family protein [Rhodocyclaceae bacterium]MBP6108948.1 creatininase family protein [Rhodocyclaceae bacterium]